MPTYDYECKACGHTFDELQSFSDSPLTKCPACKKNKLERLFGGGGAIIFKGSGFYETDYRRPPEKSSDGDGAAKAEPKTETKVEAKSETASAKPDTSGSTGSTTAPAAKPDAKGGSKKKA
jgi:putative FmdB family regulatory protein